MISKVLRLKIERGILSREARYEKSLKMNLIKRNICVGRFIF